MSFVYRYLDYKGDVRYIGMVKGDTFDCLIRRLKQHRSDGFRETWKIQYVEVPTRTDADLLESHLIGSCQRPDLLVNKAKLHYGRITICRPPSVVWEPIVDGLLSTKRQDVKARIQMYYNLLGHRVRDFDYLPKELDRFNLESLYHILTLCARAWDEVVKSRRKAK